MIDGKKLATVGFEKIGTPYETMDCQKFIEWCLKQCGLDKDLAGSNAWFREVWNNGVIMTPEECVAQLGTVPAGAFLFILEDDGGEPEKYRADGLGNASHIGIVTGKGKGAIHSGKTAGGVAESLFRNKTVKNGGWNRVGLYNKVSYDYVSGGSAEPEPVAPEPEPEIQATVTVGAGQNVITRKGPGKGYAMSKAGRLPDGARVTILEQTVNSQGESWSRIRCVVDGVTWICWMINQFLTAADSGESSEPAMDPGDGFPEDPSPGEDLPADGGADEVALRIRMSRAEAAALLAVAERISRQTEQIMGGRG